MRIHTQGISIILKVIAIAGLIAVLTIVFIQPILIQWLNISAMLFITAATILFFRVPARKTLKGDDKVISAADGKVVAIEVVEEQEYFKDRRKVISVFMSAHNVHINVSPVAGVVEFFRHHPGNHFFAWQPKASKENEHTTIVIRHEKYGPVMVRQIAGAFARRIVFNHAIGSHVDQGQELGIIKFGSRVDVFLPVDVNIKVRLHQSVKGGITELARLH